jgi:assimilatory nitrate reductase catalytic subunit
MFREWESPAAVFQILKRLSAGRPCDVTGIEDYAMLDRAGGVQWPAASPQAAGDGEQGAGKANSSDLAVERRLFEDGQYYHPDGRARFVCEAPRDFPEQPSRKYPFLLLTGRGTASQWHTQTRTAKSAVLRKLYPRDLYAELNPQDAMPLGIRSGDRVSIASQRGQLVARALVTPCVQPGQVFLPMHYEPTNSLTHAAFDPYSHQPAYKSCAVAIVRAV